MLARKHCKATPHAQNANEVVTEIDQSNPPRTLCFPWTYDEISFGGDGYPCGEFKAVQGVIEYARTVMELDAMQAGGDWATQLCARANATPEQLAARFPFGITDHLRSLALEELS
jgi:hypothetical protein